ncbi:hypothetical protein [uncultured Shewanella sp.]|uniref:hypothetical protein n=1 Tax=Shewanella atlantica TaxID=271099 RepID=UPI0026165A10|nr:hypothetical protein [uncultured Shewanella sp.]
MKSTNEFKRILGAQDTLLTMSLAVLTIAGGFTLLSLYGYQDSAWSILALLTLSFSLYIIKVMLFGMATTLITIADNSAPVSQERGDRTEAQARLKIIKVKSFGLCSCCDEYETKNTLDGRYVCSACQHILVKLKGLDAMI